MRRKQKQFYKNKYSCDDNDNDKYEFVHLGELMLVNADYDNNDWNDDFNDDADDEFVHLGECFEAQHHLSETHLHLQPSDQL